MLARLTLILLALPTLALAAIVGGGAIHAPPQSSATAQATVQPAATPPTITPTTPTIPPADPSECRTSCAQTYYFCRAGDHPDDCAGSWGQCVATCNSPNLSPGFSTAP